MKINKKIAVISAAIVIILAIIIVTAAGLGSPWSKKSLVGKWYKTVTDENTEYTYFLEITEENAEYIFTSKWITETVSKFDYEVLNGTEVKFFNDTVDKTIGYELINNNTGLVLTPALTSSKASEVWYAYEEENGAVKKQQDKKPRFTK